MPAWSLVEAVVSGEDEKWGLESLGLMPTGKEREQ